MFFFLFTKYYKKPLGKRGDNPHVHMCYAAAATYMKRTANVHIPLTASHTLTGYQIMGHMTLTVKFFSHQHTAGSAFYNTLTLMFKPL